ncbi:hypothetical protein KUTeg_003990 [Tegillarca granosa]|uniref:methylated diphthine methylhydrolase n=1 Tax=Tegillarca granosa TaxID=220873 RepID=A0ABQ9FNN2_TEGGR|nr:hypothetical protein KUTeg_003990 [Tegillarca granosa]
MLDLHVSLKQDDDSQNATDTDNASGGSSQKRIGRLYVYRVQQQNDCPQLELQTSLETAGLLDIKWCPSLFNGYPVFGLVSSSGQLQIYKLERTNSDDLHISLLCEKSVSDTECLGLSLDWSNRLDKSCVQITCSSSDGFVSSFNLTEKEGLNCLSSWKAHEFEAWITAFDYWNTNIIYTGNNQGHITTSKTQRGDDCRLKVWDCRQNTSSPVFTSKRHTMGVCSIQSNSLKEHILCTGSYDEQLLIWDTRQMRSPIKDSSLGGGIWRIKWHPSNRDFILTATMYNGFHIVNSNLSKETDMEIVCHYTDHESIAYGADWCHLKYSKVNNCTDSNDENKTPDNLISTCSFYDHLLKLWNWKFELINSS